MSGDAHLRTQGRPQGDETTASGPVVPTGPKRGAKGRTRRSAKSAGTSFETLVCRYLAVALNDDRIERRRLSGANDRGDITGLRIWGKRGVLEMKDYGGSVQVGPWLNEAERERNNDDALFAAVVAKRRGTTKPEDQVVFMTLRDFATLVTGDRP